MSASVLVRWGRHGSFRNVCSDMTVISAPVSILNSTAVPCIDNFTCHSSSLASSETDPRNHIYFVSSPFLSQATSFTVFVLQATSKWPVLLHLRHRFPRAGQAPYSWKTCTSWTGHFVAFISLSNFRISVFTSGVFLELFRIFRLVAYFIYITCTSNISALCFNLFWMARNLYCFLQRQIVL